MWHSATRYPLTCIHFLAIFVSHPVLQSTLFPNPLSICFFIPNICLILKVRENVTLAIDNDGATTKLTFETFAATCFYRNTRWHSYNLGTTMTHISSDAARKVC